MKSRNSSYTRRRILDAAAAEFAARGLAGGRVDRIAEAAKANKRLIYAHFKSKEGLFDAVIWEQVILPVQSIPFDAADLPAFASAVLNLARTSPFYERLARWRRLERPTPTDVENASHTARLQAISAAQKGGIVDPRIDPRMLLALVTYIAAVRCEEMFDIGEAHQASEWRGPHPLLSLGESVAAAIRKISSPS